MEKANIVLASNYEEQNYQLESLELEKQEREIQVRRNMLTDKKIGNIEIQIGKILNVLEQQNVEIEIIKKDNEGLKTDNEDFKKKIYILANNAKEWREWRDDVNRRVLYHCGNDKSSIDYILLSDCYRKWIHTDVAKAVGSPCPSKIHYSDNDKSAYEASLVNIKNWYPDKFRKNKKIEEYMNKYNKNMLTGEKLVAWERYLDKTGGC